MSARESSSFAATFFGPGDPGLEEASSSPSSITACCVLDDFLGFLALGDVLEGMKSEYDLTKIDARHEAAACRGAEEALSHAFQTEVFKLSNSLTVSKYDV